MPLLYLWAMWLAFSYAAQFAAAGMDEMPKLIEQEGKIFSFEAFLGRYDRVYDEAANEQAKVDAAEAASRKLKLERLFDKEKKE